MGVSSVNWLYRLIHGVYYLYYQDNKTFIIKCGGGEVFIIFGDILLCSYPGVFTGVVLLW